MKSFRQLREGVDQLDGNVPIIASKKFTVFRDGGSHGHEVLNPEECGYCQVVQDFSINSKRKGTEGGWHANPPPPNHTQRHLISVENIRFV